MSAPAPDNCGLGANAYRPAALAWLARAWLATERGDVGAAATCFAAAQECCARARTILVDHLSPATAGAATPEGPAKS